VIIFGALYAYMQICLPDVSVLNDVTLQVPLRVYSADGKLIAEYGSKRRAPVSINQVPKQLIQAIIATEDARFYSHPGVDLIGIVRAAIAVISSGHKVQGASTITMQVARNFYLSPKKTYSRKIKEILLAIKIDKELSKDKILELYLNKVYFGSRAYGVSAAAHVYYGKSLNELTLPELAMIAGLPQAPSRNNPLNDPEAALMRRNHVLKRMLDVGYIDKKTYEAAIKAPITTHYHQDRVQLDAPYVAEMVRAAMVMMYGPRAYDSGLNVYTTISSELQNDATDALQSGLVAYSVRHGMRRSAIPKVQGAIVVLNPENGAVLALNGGYDFEYSAFNRALQAERQPGSSFKPFLYSAALAKGFTLATTINDAPIMVRDSGENSWWRPENDDDQFYGPTRLRVALAESRNLVSIRLLSEIGIPYALDYIQRFGFDSNELPHTLSLALGSGVITPMQLAEGYAVFANGGHQVTPYFINKIVDENGKVIYQAKPKLGEQVITQQNAYLMTQAMKSVIQNGTAEGAKILNRHDLAGKTGTTNNQIDAWFSGFNSNVLATVWVGFDNSQTSLHEYGAQVALPIWINFMKNALANQPEATMPEPAGIVTARINPKTGLLASSREKNAIFEIFQKR
jgi:penicillin-binding protein 1A